MHRLHLYHPYHYLTDIIIHFYDLGFNLIIPELTTANGNKEKSVFLSTADTDNVFSNLAHILLEKLSSLNSSYVFPF